MEAEEVEELVVQVQVGTYIQWLHNLFNKRGLPLHSCFRLQKVQSSAVLRKLCQPGVYVLVCVAASLYVIVVIVFMTCT